MNIALDIDNTLHSFHHQMDSLARESAVSLPYDEMHYYNAWLPPLEPLGGRDFYRAVEPHLLSSPPYPHACEVVQYWKDRGHSLLLVSHRPPDNVYVVSSWLDSHSIPYDHVECCGSKKVELFPDYSIDWVIDDHPNTLVESLLQGYKVATLLHPWTANFQTVDRVLVARDWLDLRERLPL